MLKEKKNTGPKWSLSLMLKSMIPNPYVKPDLIAVSTFPRNIVIISQHGTSWSSSSKVICHMGHPYLYPYSL